MTLAIAWGHDLLEDTTVTEADIRRAAGPNRGIAILAGIKALTRDKAVWPDKKEWLRHVALRFCRLCDKSGFAECFDALTGAGQRDRAYTWTASIFLLLASDFLAPAADKAVD